MLAVHLLTTRPSESFDSFLLQARGAEQSDGNASLVGSFMSPLPSISKPLSCQDLPSSSLTDKGRPVLLHNLTFTWLSPSSDHGDIRFTASIAKGESDSPPSLLSLSSLVFLSQTGSISSLRAVRSPSTPSLSPSEAVAELSPVSGSVTTRPAQPALQTWPTTSPSSLTTQTRSSSPSAWAARSWTSQRRLKTP